MFVHSEMVKGQSCLLYIPFLFFFLSCSVILFSLPSLLKITKDSLVYSVSVFFHFLSCLVILFLCWNLLKKKKSNKGQSCLLYISIFFLLLLFFGVFFCFFCFFFYPTLFVILSNSFSLPSLIKAIKDSLVCSIYLYFFCCFFFSPTTFCHSE